MCIRDRPIADQAFGQVKFVDGDGNEHKIKYIAAGDMHALAVDVDGHVWRWGYNEYGQLGNGAAQVEVVETPAMLESIENVVAVSAGNSHSLALDAKGQVWGWGRNHHGQVGVSNSETNGGSAVVVKPVRVYGFSTTKQQTDPVTGYEVEPYRLSSVIQIAAGGDHLSLIHI